MPNRAAHAGDEVCHTQLARGCRYTGGLRHLLQKSFIFLKCMGVERLEKPSEPCRHNHRPDLECQATVQHFRRAVDPTGIHHEDRLQQRHVWTKCHRQHSDDLHHLGFVVPSTFAPQQVDIGRAQPLQSCHVSHQESRFIADENLWHRRLYVRPIANKSDMGQTCPSLCPRCPFKRL